MRSAWVCLATLGAIGCGHSQPGSNRDAETTDGIAADVLGSAFDAASDAPLDASIGSVTITVYDPNSGIPAPGEDVVFQNGDGSVVATMSTDSQGSATAVMATGGSVTARGPTPTGYSDDRIFTFAGVKPGDHLVVGSPASPVVQPFQANIALPAYAGAYEYSVTTKCGAGGAGSAPSPVAVVHLTCSTVDVYVAALDTTVNHYTMGAFYKTGVTITSGSTVDLSNEAYTPLQNVPVTLQNVPSIVGQIFVSYWLFDGNVAFDGRTTVAVGSGTATATIVLPSLAGLQLVTDIDLVATQQHNGAMPSERIEQVVPYGSTYTLDVSTDSVAWMPAYVAYDAAASQLAWMELAGGTTADFARAEMLVTRSGGGIRFRHEMAGPYTAGHLDFPVLPAPFAAYNQQSADTYAINKFYIASVTGGWDAMRPTVFQLFANLLPPGFHAPETSIGSSTENSVTP